MISNSKAAIDYLFHQELSDLPKLTRLFFRKKWFGLEDRLAYSPRGARDFFKKARDLSFQPINLLSKEVGTDRFRAFFREKFPQEADLIVLEANSILAGQINLFGQTFEFPRNEDGALDWHTDPKTGRLWNPIFYFKRLAKNIPPGTDVKFVWELSRCQYFIRLGQAYALTSDERYARAYLDHLVSWIAQNPVKYGVNWASSMEVALRACSWVVSWEFFKRSPSVPAQFERMILTPVLWEHGHHLEEYPEWAGRISTNHYLANLLGLLYLGIALDQHEWIVSSLEEFEKQIQIQIQADGFHHEGSLTYHKLIAELFVYVFHLLGKLKEKVNLPENERALIRRLFNFEGKIKKMFEILMEVSDEEARIPLFGDNDSSRIHPWADHDDDDVRSLLALGSLAFNTPSLKLTEDVAPSEIAWLYGEEGISRWENLQKVNLQKSVLSPGSSGLAVLKGDLDVLVFFGCPNGTKGLGNHSHNDKLSFTLTVGRDAFFIDPGTGIYGGNPELRNRLRSTSSHNTVQVDGMEQGVLDPRRLFRLGDDANVAFIDWKDGEYVSASHQGYSRLPSGVLHRRKIRRNTEKLGWTVEDAFETEGVHEYEWFFILGPEIHPDKQPQAVRLQGREGALWLTPDPALVLSELKQVPWSPAYGDIRETWGLRASLRREGSFKIQILLTYEPSKKS